MRQVAVAEVIADLRGGTVPTACRQALLLKGFTKFQATLVVRHALVRTRGRIRTRELCSIVQQLRAGVQYKRCLSLLIDKQISRPLATLLMKRAVRVAVGTCTLDNDFVFRSAFKLLQAGYGLDSTVTRRVSLEQQMPRRLAALYAHKANLHLASGSP